MDLPLANLVVVRSKADLPQAGVPMPYSLALSSVTGEGINELLDLIRGKMESLITAAGEILPSRIRHVQLLTQSRLHLDHALALRVGDLELAADALRLAADALGRIAGAVDTEDLLDVIFSQFCIGK